MSTSRSAFLGAMSAIALLALPASALARDTPKVFVMDRCEPDSFNAAVEPGTCVRNGGVTFDKFLRRLNPRDGGHNAWRFSRHHVTLKPGGALVATDTGGETHTFTEVVDFGAGIVPPLNAALAPGTPPATPVEDVEFIDPGQSVAVGSLSPGTHRFECLIHPWMRTVVEQQ